MVRLRARRARRDSGSAAVEFALVVPVLLLIVFGIIDFGIYFSDSLSVRQGVREGAREGVVKNCSTMSCLANLTKDRINTIAGGQEYVKIFTTPSGWDKGNELTVCAVTVVNGATGLTPLPGDSTVRAKVTMRIEQDAPPAPSGGYQDGSPPGGGWSFCS